LFVGFESDLDNLQAIADRFHGGSLGGDGFDAFHNEVAEDLWDFRIEGDGFFSAVECDFVLIDEAFIFSAHRGGNMFAGEAPVHGGSEVVDIGCGRDFTAVDLFWRDVIDGALYSFLDGAYGAGLAEVDDLGFIFVGGDDVVGFHVSVDEARLVHIEERFCDLLKYFDGIEDGFRWMLIERDAIDELHNEEEFGDSDEFAVFDYLVNIAQFGMLEFGADLIFDFGLIEESLIFLGIFFDMFERPDVSGFGILDEVQL